MKTTTNKIRIVYYDKNGEHETKPCENITLVCVNYSVPKTAEPTCTFSQWFDDEESGHSELITVPFTHAIESAPEPGEQKKCLDENKNKTIYICWDEDEKTGNFNGYRIFKGDELYKTYSMLYQTAELGTGYVPDMILSDLVKLQNEGYKVEMFF